MDNFYEAILTIEVAPMMAKVYKKAIEDENSRYWSKNIVKDAIGNEIVNEIKPVWNGNYCHVEIAETLGENSELIISLISRTLPNLKKQVDYYERMGAAVLKKNYKDDVM